MSPVPPPSCPAHGESAPLPSKSPIKKPSLTLTGTEALVAKQVDMITGENLSDNFLDVIRSWPPSPNFLPLVRFITWDNFSWKDLVFSCEDGEFGPEIVVTHHEVDESGGSISCTFRDINVSSVLWSMRDAWNNAKKPSFVMGYWAYDPPIDSATYLQRHSKEKIPNKIVTDPSIGKLNYKMIFWESECIVTSDEQDKLLQIFNGLGLDYRLLRLRLTPAHCTLSVPNTKISDQPLGVFSPEDWMKFNKLGQRFFYAHIRQALKQVWDAQTKEELFKKIAKKMERKKRIKKFFIWETSEWFTLKKEWFFADETEKQSYILSGSKEHKIDYVWYVLAQRHRWTKDAYRELAIDIVEEFEDSDTWQDYFAQYISENIQPSTARAIIQARYFSATGMNDDTRGRKDLRGGFSDFELQDIWAGLNILESILPAIFIKIRSLSQTNLTLDEYRSAFNSLLQPILRIVMRWSGSDLQSSDPEEFEKFLNILNIRFDASCAKCSYDFPPEADISTRRKRIQDIEAVGCPALFVPGMVEEIIDFYTKEMFLYAEEQ